MAVKTKSICNNKAVIVWSDDLVELKSYDTTMARAKSLGGGAYKLLMLSTVESHYSTTTCKHVNEFMRELGLPVLNKQKYLRKGAELYAEVQNAFADEVKNQNRLYTALSIIRENGLEREAFMELYRESNELSEQMTVEDCKEVFLGILKGQADLNRELLENLCSEYETDLDEVISGMVGWREYVCEKVFEMLFADLPCSVIKFGFNSWEELYDHIVDNEIDELKTEDDCVVRLIEDYAGAYIPSLLEHYYIDVKYIVRGVKERKVNLSDITE